MQLGREAEESADPYPGEVCSVKHIVFVSCGGKAYKYLLPVPTVTIGDNTAVIDIFGNVHTMGNNEYGQRGVGHNNDENPLATLVPMVSRHRAFAVLVIKRIPENLDKIHCHRARIYGSLD